MTALREEGRQLGRKSCEVAERQISVLGHYPAYIEKASELGAKRFSIPAEVWNKMTAAEQWAANKKFLDRLIQRGDEVLLTTPIRDIKPGSYLMDEVRYLLEQGYRAVDGGTRMMPGL